MAILYDSSTDFEKKEEKVKMEYERKPTMLIVTKSVDKPAVVFLRKISRTCGQKVADHAKKYVQPKSHSKEDKNITRDSKNGRCQG